MVKDRRYDTVKKLHAAGYIIIFRQIFDIIPKSVIAKAIGMDGNRFTRHMACVEFFELQEIFFMADLFEIDKSAFLKIIVDQYFADPKAKVNK